MNATGSSTWKEAEAFDALWDQYADAVYNLAIRLAGSAKAGWLLARSALLIARQDLAEMGGHTPTMWLSEITAQVWYEPYQEQQSFWKRWFGTKKYQWETLLPDSVASGLTHLADRQEAILLLLNSLSYPERMMAVLRLADDYSAHDAGQIAHFSEGQVHKFTQRAVERLSQTLAKSGITVSAADRAKTIGAFLREWKPLKAPLALKADVIEKRVFQKRMKQDHVPNQYSLKGIVWVWVAVLSLFIGSLGYYLVTGRRQSAAISDQLLHPESSGSSVPKTGR